MAVVFGQPDPHHLGGCLGQRGGAVFAALAVAADVRARTEVDIAAGEAGQFGHAQPGLAGKQQ